MAEGLRGAALGEGRERQLLVHQPDSKALRLHNSAAQTLQSEITAPLVLGGAPAVLICG